jgi:preprotein translocase subunit YajC
MLFGGNGETVSVESSNALILKSFPTSDVIITPGDIGIPSMNGRIRLNGPIEIQGTTGTPSNITTINSWLKLSIENATARTAKVITNSGVVVQVDDINGPGSLQFSANTNRLTIPSTSDFAFGTGDFCIETLIYRDVINTTQYIFDFRDSDSDTATKLVIFVNSSNQVIVQVNGTTILSGGSITTGAGWSGIAVSRLNGTTRLFVSGAPVATYTDNNNYVAARLTVGNSINFNSGLVGELDEIRISKENSRYSAGSFSIDRQNFIDDGNTVLLIHADTDVSDDAVSGIRATYYLPLYQ